MFAAPAPVVAIPPVSGLPPACEPAVAAPWEPLPPLGRILPVHVAYVRAVVRRLSGSTGDGQEDLAQEVLFAAHRSRRSRLEARALLFGIARHAVLKWRAKRRAEGAVLVLGADEAAVTAPGAEDAWQARLRREFVRMAVDHLPGPLREVFMLTQIDGTPMPRVAKKLGIPLNTGYTRLHAARARFRECLERLLALRGMKGEELL